SSVQRYAVTPSGYQLTQRARGWQFNPSRISPIKTGRSAGPYRRDEVDFPMNVSSLEQLRGIFDRSEIGWALIGAAGMERHVARSSWLCSRVGFGHCKPKKCLDPQAGMLERPDTITSGDDIAREIGALKGRLFALDQERSEITGRLSVLVSAQAKEMTAS